LGFFLILSAVQPKEQSKGGKKKGKNFAVSYLISPSLCSPRAIAEGGREKKTAGEENTPWTPAIPCPFLALVLLYAGEEEYRREKGGKGGLADHSRPTMSVY